MQKGEKVDFLFAIYRYFPYGGLQKDFLRMAYAALEKGHSVRILAASWEGERVPGMEIELLKVSGLTNHGKMASFAEKVRKRRKDFPASLLFAFNRFAGADYYFAADNCLAGRVRKKHPAWVLKLFPRYSAILEREREVFAPGLSTKIFYIVERQKEEYIAAYGTEEERFIYLPPGIDERCLLPENPEAVRKEKRETLGIKEGEKLLLLVGANLKGKGADRVLKGVAALPEEMRKNIRIFFAGSTGEKEMKNAAENLALQEKVIFGGGRRDVPELLLAADLMVHPAREEATGTVLAEALAMGLPVIASGECGFAPLVEEYGGKALAEPFRQEELAEVLEEMLSGENLAACRQKILQRCAGVDFHARSRKAIEWMEKNQDV